MTETVGLLRTCSPGRSAPACGARSRRRPVRRCTAAVARVERIAYEHGHDHKIIACGLSSLRPIPIPDLLVDPHPIVDRLRDQPNRLPESDENRPRTLLFLQALVSEAEKRGVQSALQRRGAADGGGRWPAVRRPDSGGDGCPLAGAVSSSTSSRTLNPECTRRPRRSTHTCPDVLPTTATLATSTATHRPIETRHVPGRH